MFYFIFYKKNQITSSSSVTCMDFTMKMIPCFVCGSLLKSSLNEITNGRAFIEQTIKVKAALECCLFSELLDLESVLGNKRTKWYHWWLEYPEITLNRGITPQPSPPEKKNAREPQANMLLMFSLHLRRFLRFLIELNTGIKEQNIKQTQNKDEQWCQPYACLLN